jgi:casein kinase II subunit beta
MSFSEDHEEDAVGAIRDGETKGLEDDEDDDLSGESSQQSDSSDDDVREEVSWITWFLSLKGNEFFCEIEDEYIQDEFNLTGLNSMIPYYDFALDMMLDVDIPTERLTDEQLEVVEAAAEVLYGLIHVRYILTARGMQRMKDKFASEHFGKCPRVFCQGQPMLPVGISDTPRNYSVAAFCPRCRDIFYPKSARQANLDGAYFGTTFAHLFLISYPELIPAKIQQAYIPRVFGFKVHKESPYWQHAVLSPAEEEPTPIREARGASSNNDLSSPVRGENDAVVAARGQAIPEVLPPAPPAQSGKIRVDGATTLSALPPP